METYIALLRGINVSGQKSIKMAVLKEVFEGQGFSDVITYIQSGNVVFKSTAAPEEMLQNKIKDAIQSNFGYEVPVLVRKRAYLREILDQNPFASQLEQAIFEDKKMYYTLLSDRPEDQILEHLEIHPSAGEEYAIQPENRVVYFYAANGYGKTKLTNNLFENKLKCSATTRNLRTLRKLLELSAPN